MSLIVQIDAPFVPIAEYARRTGQTVKAVACQCDLGQLPFRTFTQPGKRGKRHINMLALMKEAEEGAGS